MSCPTASWCSHQPRSPPAWPSQRSGWLPARQKSWPELAVPSQNTNRRYPSLAALWSQAIRCHWKSGRIRAFCRMHAEVGRGVDAPYGYCGFGDLGVAGAGFQVGSEDGLVAGHRGFGEGSSVVARLDLPGLGPDLTDAANGIAPGRGRVLFLGRGGDGGPGFRRNDGCAPMARMARWQAMCFS